MTRVTNIMMFKAISSDVYFAYKLTTKPIYDQSVANTPTGNCPVSIATTESSLLS